MQPTIPIDSWVIWETMGLDSGTEVKRFDIVLHTLPSDEKRQKRGIDENTLFIFRVVGLGGEKVEVRKGKVLINDIELIEPFKTSPPDNEFGPIVVPVNELFLLGDNRPESEDSRYWKPATIGRERIIGKVARIL